MAEETKDFGVNNRGFLFPTFLENTGYFFNFNINTKKNRQMKQNSPQN